MDDRDLTPARVLEAAKELREGGFDEAADLFESVATKIALFNEQNPHTIEELRQRLGNEKFFEVLEGLQ